MSDQPTAQVAPRADGHSGLRVLALCAVVVGVLLLMAAAFVLSYAGIHAVALSVGVSPRLARLYPLVFDAMLVVACAAVLALRGAGLPSRCYAWLSMLALLVAVAGADALHATGTVLPHKPAAATAAVTPWALVLMGFTLLLIMMRQTRLRRTALPASRQRAVPERIGHVEVRPRAAGGLPQPKASGAAVSSNGRAADGSDRAGGGTSGPGDGSHGTGGGPARIAEAEPAADPAVDLAIDTEPGQDDPTSDEGRAGDPPGQCSHRVREQQAAGSRGYGNRSASAFSPAPTMVDGGAKAEARFGGDGDHEDGPDGEAGPAAVAGPGAQTQVAEPGLAPMAAAAPQFDRVRSSPVPPEG